jgi:signal peptidase I
MVDGKPLDESAYLPAERDSPLELPPTPGQCGPRVFAKVLVPAGQIFVMGDNRAVSQDSRCQGPVPIDNVIGRAFAVAWPSSRWSSLPALTKFADTSTASRPAAPGLRSAATREGAATEGPEARASGASAVNSDTGAAWVLVAPFLAALAIPARSRRLAWHPQRRLLE